MQSMIYPMSLYDQAMATRCVFLQRLLFHLLRLEVLHGLVELLNQPLLRIDTFLRLHAQVREINIPAARVE